MTTPTQGEHAQTEALRPKFGDLLRNTMASESNPRRDAYFIREVHRSGGGVNPGRWFEMTDGNGETWLSNPQNLVPVAPEHPAAPQGVAYAALADVDALAQEIRRVDGSHNLGAGALAEALMPFLRASHGQAPAGAAQWAYSEIETRIKELMAGTAHPESMSVAQAMKQLVNELWQRYGQAPTAQAAPAAADFTTLGAAMRAIQQAIDLIGEPADDRMRTVKRVLRGAVIVAEDSGELSAPAAGAVAGPSEGEILAAARNWGDVEPYLCRSGSGEQKHRVVFHVHERAAHFAKELLATAPTQAAQADSVLEDAARLDWLDQQCEAYGFQDIHEGNRWEISGAYANVREAIDAESAARKQGGTHDNH